MHIQGIIDQVKSGITGAILPGIFITGLVEDQYSERNLGLDQARFSTATNGVEALIRFSEDEDGKAKNPDIVLVDNDEFDIDSFIDVDIITLAKLVGETLIFPSEDSATAISSTNKVKHEIITNLGITQITVIEIGCGSVTTVVSDIKTATEPLILQADGTAITLAEFLKL